jgi:hypothetical protein
VPKTFVQLTCPPKTLDDKTLMLVQRVQERDRFAAHFFVRDALGPHDSSGEQASQEFTFYLCAGVVPVARRTNSLSSVV